MKRILSTAEKLEMRKHHVWILRHGLPSLIEVPIPAAVREAPWFQRSKIEKKFRHVAFPAFGISGFSGKFFAARGLCEQFEAEGRFKRYSILYSPSSGNLGKDLSLVSMAYDVLGVIPVVSSTLSKGKEDHLWSAGVLDIAKAPAGMEATEYARQLVDQGRGLLVDQYIEKGSIEGHYYSMEHIAHQMVRLGEKAGFNFAAVTGTCSTLCGARKYLVPKFDAPVKLIGVASMSPAEKVPGARSLEEIQKLESIGGFYYRPEWKNLLDFPVVQSVTCEEAFERNAEMFQRDNLSAGPTSALLDSGIYYLLRDHAKNGTLEQLQNKRGQYVFCSFFMDSLMAYQDNQAYMKHFRAPMS